MPLLSAALAALAALAFADVPPPTGEGYLVQVEQGSGRRWQGYLSRFEATGPEAWECLWREVRPGGTHDWKRKVAIRLAGGRITLEEREPSALWAGTYRRAGRRLEAEGTGRKGAYRRHYCTFSLRATLPEPPRGTAEAILSGTAEAGIAR